MIHAIERAWASRTIGRPSSYKPIPRILCATDLSPESGNAVQRAVMLAKKMDALLLLLHVVDEKHPLEIIGLMAARARSTLQELTGSAEIEVRAGKPCQTIARVIKEWDADLVVLGAYRKHSGDQFFGTAAERVIRAAKRTVLIVNSKPTGPYQDILLAIDLSDASAHVLRMAQQLGLLDGVRASIVHVLGDATRSMLYSSAATEAQIGGLLRATRQSSRRELIAQLDAADLDSRRFAIIQKHGAPFGEIVSAVEEAKPQLLVLGATRYPTLKRLLGTSVANDVLRGIDCDVLIASADAVRHLRELQPEESITDLARDASVSGWPMHWC
jgi:nucleotide-binding universal stress UspA family protein